MTIRNPVQWSVDLASLTGHALRSAGNMFLHTTNDTAAWAPQVRHIELSDLKEVLLSGLRDFGAYRTDVIFICFIYPLAGLVIAQLSVRLDLLPLLFPLVSGFALIGPFAATGLYEMSRRQEQGLPVSWADAFRIYGSPSFVAIIKLGLVLVGIFLIWLATAMGIYLLTMGPAMPTSVASFATDVFTTRGGWAMIGIGITVGFLFALVVLAISVVSFPLLLDRPVRISTAIGTSVRAVMLNPIPMLAWGLIVAASLVLGMLPFLIGLIVVMPVLGHATWHLYRKVVV